MNEMLSIVAEKEGQKGAGKEKLQPVLAALLREGVHFGHELLGTTSFTGTRLGGIALCLLVLQLLFLLRPLLPLHPTGEAQSQLRTSYTDSQQSSR